MDIFLCNENLFQFIIDENKTTTIRAHQSPLSCLELNPSGCKLATASGKVNYL